jgi:hypothetical protein
MIVMSRSVIAEYDAAENALRLAEPLAGVKDHEKVRVSVETDEQSFQNADPVARLASLNAPSGDIQQMLAEIEAGRR